MEILEVFVICEYLHRVLCTQEEGASALKTEDNTSKFSIVDVVIPFC